MTKRRSWGLLLLLLLTFARLTISLGAKDLWLDESFSLQRAESDLPTIMAGTVHIVDGVESVRTVDQHPFGFFLLLGLMLRVAGISEFALRFPSVMAATLIVPAAWVLARRLERCRALPPGAAGWAAILAALNPFYLWFGQEVRMYSLVALMALLSTYMVLCWSEDRSPRRHWYVLGYLVTVSLLLTAHYYSVFILPLQASIVYVRLAPNRRRALWVTGVVLAIGLLTAVLAALQLISQPGAGTNFASVSLRVLVPDLVNAFTLGLSVNLADVWLIDLLSAVVVVLGVLWGPLHRRGATRNAWLLPVFLAVPVLLLAGINLLRPAYMTSRHMSLVSGAYLLLLGGGLAWLWRKQRWLGAVIASVLLGGMFYSSVNYYVAPQYGKGDMAGIGVRLNETMQPGDLLLIEPPSWARLFRYYLPLDAIERWQKAGQPTGWRAMPPLSGNQQEDIGALLASLRGQYRRIWLARSVVDSTTGALLKATTFHAQDWGFESPFAFLHLDLFQVDSPFVDQIPETAHPVADAAFSEKIWLRGYEVGQPFEPGYAVPVTLYWQVPQQPDRRYKYVLRWIVRGADGVEHVLATTEKEPYDGILPTTKWIPGTLVREYTSILPPKDRVPGESHLSLQVYDAETLQKLPLRLTSADNGQTASDDETLILSDVP